jgi:hypothetical protein
LKETLTFFSQAARGESEMISDGKPGLAAARLRYGFAPLRMAESFMGWLVGIWTESLIGSKGREKYFCENE